MKKLLISFVAVIATLTISANELGETQLGKWICPAKTDVANVDAYIAACAQCYQEAMDIRAQYDAIEKVNMDDANNAISSAAGDEVDNTLDAKKGQYQAVIDRIAAQQDAVSKLPAMLESATKSVPKNLKAPQIIKSINATKDAVKLAVEENAGVLKAATADLASLTK